MVRLTGCEQATTQYFLFLCLQADIAEWTGVVASQLGSRITDCPY